MTKTRPNRVTIGETLLTVERDQSMQNSTLGDMHQTVPRLRERQHVPAGALAGAGSKC